MTNRIVVAAFVAIVAVTSNAQVVINHGDIPRQPGSVVAYWTATDQVNGIEVDVGNAGEDRLWDLTAYQFDEVAYDTLVDPAVAPDSESFPDANRVLNSASNDLGLNFGTGYQYEVLADSGWYMLGVAGGAILNQPIVYPTPMVILPMPAEYGASWDIGVHYQLGMPVPDTLRGMLGQVGDFVDSLYVRINLGGTASLDGWGIVRFSGGDVRALRQKISTGGRIAVVAVGRLPFIGRFEQEIPGLGYNIEALQTYRWFSAGIGEIASMTSRVGEQDPNFNMAAQVRVRRIVPDLAFGQNRISFGEVHVGNAGIASYTLRNSGEGVGIISRIDFTNRLGEEIECITDLPLVISPDSSARLRFLWSPQEEKSLVGQQMLLYHNDPDTVDPLPVELAGQTPNYDGVATTAGGISGFELVSVYPNPFNGETTASFALTTGGLVKLTVVDGAGRSVRQVSNCWYAAGEQHQLIDLADLPSGSYLLDLRYSGRSYFQRLNLVR